MELSLPTTYSLESTGARMPASCSNFCTGSRTMISTMIAGAKANKNCTTDQPSKAVAPTMSSGPAFACTFGLLPALPARGRSGTVAPATAPSEPPSAEPLPLPLPHWTKTTTKALSRPCSWQPNWWLPPAPPAPPGAPDRPGQAETTEAVPKGAAGANGREDPRKSPTQSTQEGGDSASAAKNKPTAAASQPVVEERPAARRKPGLVASIFGCWSKKAVEE
mmetsp:Transcript_133234/g.426068  ORF Transcript_133234/g.426068 Transcript_133234/m.426068 type:complete len:221 (-) Transcript_133234:79-741(-)